MSKVTQRQIHLVDIDNLTGGPSKDQQLHSEIREWYDIHSDRREEDLCFVGMSHYSAIAASKAWEGAKLVWASGQDGADLALINLLEETNFSSVSRLCLGSGDWIFKFALSPFISRGVKVGICCRENSLSNQLNELTEDVTFVSNYSNKDFRYQKDLSYVTSWECKGPSLSFVFPVNDVNETFTKKIKSLTNRKRKNNVNN